MVRQRHFSLGVTETLGIGSAELVEPLLAPYPFFSAGYSRLFEVTKYFHRRGEPKGDMLFLSMEQVESRRYHLVPSRERGVGESMTSQ